MTRDGRPSGSTTAAVEAAPLDAGRAAPASRVVRRAKSGAKQPGCRHCGSSADPEPAGKPRPKHDREAPPASGQQTVWRKAAIHLRQARQVPPSDAAAVDAAWARVRDEEVDLVAPAADLDGLIDKLAYLLARWQSPTLAELMPHEQPWHHRLLASAITDIEGLKKARAAPPAEYRRLRRELQLGAGMPADWQHDGTPASYQARLAAAILEGSVIAIVDLSPPAGQDGPRRAGQPGRRAADWPFEE